MAKKQKSRAQSLRVNGQTIRVSSRSDLDASVIKLMLDHVDGQIARFGEEYTKGDWGLVISNKALAAAFRAKGFIH